MKLPGVIIRSHSSRATLVEIAAPQAKERPILFSGPMVRAIREGRKTQTRRIVKSQRDPYGILLGPKGVAMEFLGGTETMRCPYGQHGDRLWVRETWNAWRQCNLEYNEWDTCDCAPSEIKERYGAVKLEYAATSESVGPWRPSIHMPRWASRITLEIVGVRMERLQDISNEDCWKEGMYDETNPQLKANRRWFSELWESINGVGSWTTNPYVWVIEFKEVKT